VQKKLDSLKLWNTIISKIFNTNKKAVYINALKSISFFGFNEAVLNHCGIELDRTKNSESFALKILSQMKKIIEEKNDIDNDNFILSQPHYDSYLQSSWYNGITDYNPNITSYSSKLIRRESKLSFNGKIKLFKKFQRIINRGALLSVDINKEEINIQKFLETLIESKISAFSLRDCIN
jgi:hypothetical protein